MSHGAEWCEKCGRDHLATTDECPPYWLAKAEAERKERGAMSRDECSHGSLRRKCRVCELEAEVARLRRVEDAARALLTVADECIIAREHRLQGGGQQVGYHGPLASAVPSVLRDIRQMVEPLRAALEVKP